MSWSHQLPFTNPMHDCYAGDRTPRRPEGLEAEQGTREPFHRSMVLLHEVIEIFRVANDETIKGSGRLQRQGGTAGTAPGTLLRDRHPVLWCAFVTISVLLSVTTASAAFLRTVCSLLD